MTNHVSSANSRFNLMRTLQSILLHAIPDNGRTRRYMAEIDRYLSGLKQEWDLEYGLPRRAEPECLTSSNLAVENESVRSYSALTSEQRSRIGDPRRAAYVKALGRSGTAPLALSAFAWHCPLSRFHHDPELLQYFENGLKYFTDCIHDEGIFGATGLNGLDWAHGWDVEGLIYGLVFTEEALNSEVSQRARQRLRLCAERFLQLDVVGTHGNQLAVYSLGLWLYGQLFEMPEAIVKADASWLNLMPKILDDSGQVIEQYGPCMHYSYTGFFYAWLNIHVRGDEKALERVEKCLLWFRDRHTASLYPMAGPSSRLHYELPNQCPEDLMAGCEQISQRNPMLQEWADQLWETSSCCAQGHDHVRRRVMNHGASPLMWAMLACSGTYQASDDQRTVWRQSSANYYELINLLGRSPLKYALIRERYQTHFNFCDWLPFSGVQTWAFGDEPPIIHPTLWSPSTTLTWGLDTARCGVSHNWGQYGAGVMAADGRFRPRQCDDELTFLVARYDRLWRVAVFTEYSTVVVEWGDYESRQTRWTLNRLAPAEAQIEDGVVSFVGRRGRIHSNIAKPRMRVVTEPAPKQGCRQEPYETQILEYECGSSFAQFALSDESFRFDTDHLADKGILEFSDAAGSYRLHLSSNFFVSTPGNIGFDVCHLAHESSAKNIEPKP